MKKENEDGYEYCERLYRMITKDKKHTLPLDEAVDFISFYGLRHLFFARGTQGLVGKVAIERLDHALVYENYRIIKRPKESENEE